MDVLFVNCVNVIPSHFRIGAVLVWCCLSSDKWISTVFCPPYTRVLLALTEWEGRTAVRGLLEILKSFAYQDYGIAYRGCMLVFHFTMKTYNSSFWERSNLTR